MSLEFDTEGGRSQGHKGLEVRLSEADKEFGRLDAVSTATGSEISGSSMLSMPSMLPSGISISASSVHKGICQWSMSFNSISIPGISTTTMLSR